MPVFHEVGMKCEYRLLIDSIRAELNSIQSVQAIWLIPTAVTTNTDIIPAIVIIPDIILKTLVAVV